MLCTIPVMGIAIHCNPGPKHETMGIFFSEGTSKQLFDVANQITLQ
jgi:hypothetical protein